MEEGIRWKSIWVWGTVLLLALAGATIGVISYFGRSSSPDVTITIWHQLNDHQLDYVAEYFNDYELEHPNTNILLSMKGATNDFSASITNLLNASIPATQGPDIIIWDFFAALQGGNAASGNIVPLDEYGITQNWLLTSYEPVIANGMVWDNRVWGIPIDQGGLALIYNKALASPSDFPEDPLNFYDLADKMGSFLRSKNIPLLCFQQTNAFFVAPLFFGFGVPTYVDEMGTVYLENSQAVSALDWLVSQL